MKRLLAIFLIALFSLSFGMRSAFAGTLTGGEYKMYVNPTTAGGGVLSGGDYVLYDTKGYPFGGILTGGDYVFIPGIPYGTGEVFELPDTPPYGTVRLYIARYGGNPSDIKLSWEIGSGPGQVDAGVEPKFYYLASSDNNPVGIYTNNQDSWEPLVASADFSIDSDAAYAIHAGQVGEGNAEVYYKAVLEGSDDKLAVAWAVGKVNVELEANKMKLMGVPLYAGKASEIFVDQLIVDQKLTLLPKSGTGLDYVTVTDTEFLGPDFDVEPTIGFWVENQNAVNVTITFAGDLVNTPITQNLAILDLTANPIAVPIDSSLIGQDGDIILPQSGSGLDYYVKASGSWGPNFPTLQMNAGFWYESVNSSKWKIEPTADTKPNAIIEIN